MVIKLIYFQHSSLFIIGFELGLGKSLEELKKFWAHLPEGVTSLEAFAKQLRTYSLMQNIMESMHNNAIAPLIKALT